MVWSEAANRAPRPQGSAEQLRAVLEAAEQSATDMRQRADAEATRIVEEAFERAAETDESSADIHRRAEAEATRIVEEARQRAAETDEWAELQAEGLRQAVAAAGALADRMGAGASAIGADLEAITWILEARPPRPGLDSPASAGNEPRSRLALPETSGPGAGAPTDRSGGAGPAAETRSASRRQTGAPSAGSHGQSSPDASLHHRSWKMRTAAFEMAVGGADRGEVARHLYTEFRLNDDEDVALVDSIVEEAFQNLEDIPPDERPRMLRRLFGG